MKATRLFQAMVACALWKAAATQSLLMAPEEAMDVFCNAPLIPRIQEGVADLRCRSDEYLAKEVLREAGCTVCGSKKLSDRPAR